MRKLILCMHVSLDGFVAGPKGEMDWIRVDSEIFDYAGHMTDEADTALYGRVTWEMMDGYWPTAADSPTATKHDIQHSRWYKEVTKVVLSRSLQAGNKEKTIVIHDDVPGRIGALKQQPGKNIQMFGSPTVAHVLMQSNLIDEYWLFVNPILLGAGIPLFRNILERNSLKLLQSQAFASGVIGLHYERQLP